MLERIVASGLHIQVVMSLLVVLFLFVYTKLIWHTRWFGVEHVNDKQWFESHKRRVLFFVGFPAIMMLALGEELVFRAPLILAFESWNREAWPWVALSSIVFGLIHYGDHMFAAMRTWSSGESVKDETGAEINDYRKRLQIVKGSMVVPRVARIARMCVTGCTGFGFAYVGITWQSIYLAAGTHFVWNIGLQFLILLVVLPFLLLRLGWEVLLERIDAVRR